MRSFSCSENASFSTCRARVLDMPLLIPISSSSNRAFPFSVSPTQIVGNRISRETKSAPVPSIAPPDSSYLRRDIFPIGKGTPMRRVLVALAVLLVVGSTARATGMLIPAEVKLPPLALVDQKVTINIEDQVAVTKIEQAFRNHTGRELEAT